MAATCSSEMEFYFPHELLDRVSSYCTILDIYKLRRTSKATRKALLSYRQGKPLLSISNFTQALQAWRRVEVIHVDNILFTLNLTEVTRNPIEFLEMVKDFLSNTRRTMWEFLEQIITALLLMIGGKKILFSVVERALNKGFYFLLNEDLAALCGSISATKHFLNLIPLPLPPLPLPEKIAMERKMRYATHFSLFSKSLEVTQLLMDHPLGKSACNENYYFLENLGEKASGEVIRDLLSIPSFAPCSKQNSLLHCAASFGNLPALQALMEDDRINPASEENYAIRWAADGGHTSCCELLLRDPRVNAGVEENAALQIAVVKNYTEIVRLLVNHPSVDASCEDNRDFKVAMKWGLLEVAAILLADPKVLAKKQEEERHLVDKTKKQEEEGQSLADKTKKQEERSST